MKYIVKRTKNMNNAKALCWCIMWGHCLDCIKKCNHRCSEYILY